MQLVIIIMNTHTHVLLLSSCFSCFSFDIHVHILSFFLPISLSLPFSRQVTHVVMILISLMGDQQAVYEYHLVI